MAPQTDLRRIRRLLATTAAATVVVLVPTACDYAIASDRIPSSQTQLGREGQQGQVRNASSQSGTQDASTTAPTTAADAPEQTGGAEGEKQQAPASSTAQAPADEEKAAAPTSAQAPASAAEKPAAEQAPKPNNGLDVLAQDCSKSDLPPHDGFQKGDRCVSTAFGEVGGAAENPSLLITDAPQAVSAGQEFTMKVSTRNLIRDRFLGAAAGGYYLESSVLKDGIQRGHFHTACRMLTTTDAAPDPAPAPAFFLATQDNKGGAGEDTVEVKVTGLPDKGLAQCAVWAGDGSHRIPMMERANQTPAFDVVRIKVD
ncbi:hypothetical protein [Pseudonocardia xishanensis]|uniref:Pecanex-like protein 1 n=1 Tax=Pseudonocardia xishanensis TaxID=630995 RepID=A0ABP8RKR2_9PSEU